MVSLYNTKKTGYISPLRLVANMRPGLARYYNRYLLLFRNKKKLFYSYEINNLIILILIKRNCRLALWSGWLWRIDAPLKRGTRRSGAFDTRVLCTRARLCGGAIGACQGLCALHLWQFMGHKLSVFDFFCRFFDF